jgi:hypothetical protein
MTCVIEYDSPFVTVASMLWAKAENGENAFIDAVMDQLFKGTN